MITIKVNAALADVGFGSNEAAYEWETRITDQIIAMQPYRKFMNENQRQMGKKPGVNSGNGYLEAIIPAKLWAALEARDPEFFSDPKKWERFLKAHPELKLDLPLN